MSQIHVSPAGSDTTGDGSAVAPYATIARGVQDLPTVVTGPVTLSLAAGTYPEGLALTQCLCTGSGEIIVDGPNATLTGTIPADIRGGQKTVGVWLRGPINVQLNLAVNVTAAFGVLAMDGVTLTVNGLSVGGFMDNGFCVWAHSRCFIAGSVSVSGVTQRGIQVAYNSTIEVVSAATISVTGYGFVNGPGYTTWGVHCLASSTFYIWESAPNVHVTVSNVLYGFQLGFNSAYTHQGAQGSTTITNGTTPTNSYAVFGTDESSWSTTQLMTVSRFTRVFYLGAITWAEAIGPRAYSNITTGNVVIQNSSLLLP